MPEGVGSETYTSKEESRKRKLTAITVDPLILEEAKQQARKEGTNLSRLIEWLLKKYLAEEQKKEQQRKREEELKKEDKGKILSEQYMRKLLFDLNYGSEEWIPQE
ncbi:MAG: type II toxin-antitoxin system CcdA family antitoxin [Candidatus Bathyarchaeia archaeon]